MINFLKKILKNVDKKAFTVWWEFEPKMPKSVSKNLD